MCLGFYLFLDEIFERKDNVFATIVMEKEHTGEEIAKVTEECLVKNGLKISSIAACVRDVLMRKLFKKQSLWRKLTTKTPWI
jgi:hypothetical protein